MSSNRTAIIQPAGPGTLARVLLAVGVAVILLALAAVISYIGMVRATARLIREGSATALPTAMLLWSHLAAARADICAASSTKVGHQGSRRAE